MASEKISLYNLADLKNTSDDAIPNYLNSLKFKQSHMLSDVRLALGYSAFVLAAACFLWDYKLGFESTKHFTAGAVIVYSLINGALTYWMGYVEKGIVYQGKAPTGEKITISTRTNKLEPVYRLTIDVINAAGDEQETYQIRQPFRTFFDEAGQYVALPFQTSLASAIPVIGKRDPKRVKMASQELLDANPELLQAVLAANSAGADGSSTAAEVTDQSGGKRRKA